MNTSEPRCFAATLADYYEAGRPPGPRGFAQRAADRLPLSEWSEARRQHMNPATIAMNWRSNVADTAHELREALTAADNGGTAGSKKKIKKAARALLRALGEDVA